MAASDPFRPFTLPSNYPPPATVMRSSFLVLIALLLPVQSLACSCPVGTIDERLESAAVAFRVLVTGTELRPLSEIVESEWFAGKGFTDEEVTEILKESPNYVRVSFRLIETYKGESHIPDFLYEMTPSPGNCGLGLAAGIEYVVFSGGTPFEFATFCTGSFGFFNPDGTEVKPDLDRLRELARQ